MAVLKSNQAPSQTEVMVMDAAAEHIHKFLNTLPEHHRIAVIGMLTVNAFLEGVVLGTEIAMYDDFVQHNRSELQRMVSNKHREHRL